MPVVISSEHATIEQEYATTRQKSADLYRRAAGVLPSGVAHDARYMKPFPFYVARADKARKWDVDGNELIDLCSGHGALILGHNHPAVMAALSEQLGRGLHYSACHELEVEMAELLVTMIPCAEQVRFFLSGLEANHHALRLARAYTGRDKVVKFRGHFHGYFDEGVVGVRPPFDAPMSIGVPKSTLSNVLLARHNNSEDVARLFKATSGDIAGVIVDPICHTYTLENRPGFLEDLRSICNEHGSVLIFDEVVSGFHVGPGGAQQAFGVTPDLATFAKPMGGGLPASAVVGKREIMQVTAFTDDPRRDRHERVIIQGTHAGNPLVLAAGLATLRVLSTGEPQAHIAKLGEQLRAGLSDVLAKQHVPGRVYGGWSFVRMYLGGDWPRPDLGRSEDWTDEDHETVDRGGPAGVKHKLRLAMLLNGVDSMGGFGTMLLNSALTPGDVSLVLDAFDSSINRLKREGVL